MRDHLRPSDPSSELVEIIRQVRRRWRVKLALRGALAARAVGLWPGARASLAGAEA